MKENIEIIELFGFPGSGKTTTVNQLTKLYPDFVFQPANVHFSIPRAFSLILFLLKRRKLFKVFKWSKSVPSSLKKVYYQSLIRFCLRVQQDDKNQVNPNKLIIDEGLLQITWSVLLLPFIYDKSLDIDEALNYLIKEFWSKNKNVLIIHLNPSDNEYIKRINSRERKHLFSEAFKNEETDYIHKGKQLKDKIISKAKVQYTVKEINHE